MIYQCKKCRRMYSSYGSVECIFCDSKEIEPAEESERKQFEAGEEIARQMCDKLNAMCLEKPFNDGFSSGIQREHRTLQQNFGKLLQTIIADFAVAAKEGRYDGRNEATVKMCEKLDQIAKECYLPFV